MIFFFHFHKFVTFQGFFSMHWITPNDTESDQMDDLSIEGNDYTH